jgi:hypothetical protein
VGLGRLVAGIVGSNPASGMDVCPPTSMLCCPVRLGGGGGRGQTEKKGEMENKEIQKWLAFLLCIREVSSTNHDQETDYFNLNYRGFPQPHQVNAGIPSIRPQPLPSVSSRNDFSLVSVSYEAFSELLTVPLNKPQINI